jgi:leader peptidase (prepilin peptidase)/N-methyltransferase
MKHVPISLWATVAALFGLILGSFLNVVIYRIPNNKSLIKPRSFCPKCSHPIAAYDNIPIISWFVLRGACRNCKTSISFQYPMVELLTAAIFFTTVYFVKPLSVTPAICVLFAGVISTSVIDLKYMKLPSKILYTTLVIGLILLTLSSYQVHNFTRLLSGVVAGLVAGVILFIFFLILPPGSVGLGDVRLIAVQSVFLGWFGWRFAILGFALGIIVGGFSTLGLLAFGVKKMKDKIAFGPFLSIGAVMAVYSTLVFHAWNI